MGSIFRIARAELIKIFKRPTVYIMAFVLAALIGGSLFLFNPTKKEDTSVNMAGNSTNIAVSTLHTKFVDDASYKAKYDSYLTDAIAEINFYDYLATYKINIETTFENTYKYLIKFEDSINADEIDEFFKNFEKFINAYKNIDVATDIGSSNQPQFLKDFYMSREYSTILNDLQTAYSTCQSLNNQSNNKLISYFKTDKGLTNDYKSAKKLIEKAYSTGRTPSVAFLNFSIENIKSLTNTYFLEIGNGSSRASQGYTETARKNVETAIKDYKTALKNIVEFEPYTFAVVEYKPYMEFNTNIDAYIKAISIKAGSETSLAAHQAIKNKLDANDYISKISTISNKIIFLNCDSTLLEELTKTGTTVTTKIAKTHDDIIQYVAKNSSSKEISRINTYDKYVSTYKEINLSFKNYVHYSILNNILSEYTNGKVQNFYGKKFYNTYNEYETKELITKNNYYLTHDIYSFELNNVFAFNTNSGQETSVYDFMYFAIKISTMIIIIFSIFMAANIFASEHDSGTIKLLLIRPFKRHKIVSGKLLATLFFSTVFVLFSTLISSIIGVCVFGINTTPILVVFNSTHAIKFNPILLMILFITFTLLEIIFYVILSSAVCTLFKSYAGAITVSFVAYFITLAMNIGFGKMLWYSYSPFVNLNLFKFFGNGFIQNSNSVLSMFFNTPMLGNMNYFVSLGISSGIVAILLSVTYIIFKRRDY